MNILLVLPRIFINPREPEHFPVGMAYVSSSLKAAGHTVDILNLNFLPGTVRQEMERAFAKRPVELVATGGLVTHYHLVKEVVSCAKNLAPDLPTLIGGGLVTCAPRVVMAGIRDAEIGVIGEGEITSVEICAALSQGIGLEQVDGVIYRKTSESGETLALTKPRAEIARLDDLPWPDYSGFDLEKMLRIAPKKYITLSTGRSCSHRCTFCFHTSGKKYRQRSLDSFFRELTMLVEKYGIDNIYITDELFANDEARLREFCARIQRYDILWAVQLRVDVISRDMVQLLKDSGCIILSLGLESASNRILKSMRKGISIAQIEQALRCCHEVGIKVHGSFIFGDIEEDNGSAEETLAWWSSHRQYNINLAMIQVYPGTHLYNHALKTGIITDELKFIEEGCPYVNVSRLSDGEYRRLAIKLDKIQAETPNSLREIQITGEDRRQRKIDVKGRCGVCGGTVAAEGVHAAKIASFVCDHCASTITVTPIAMFSKNVIANLRALLATRKVVFAQVTKNMADIFRLCPFVRAENCLVVDSSSLKHGHDELYGEIHGYQRIEPGYDAAVVCDYLFDSYFKNSIRSTNPHVANLFGIWEIIQPHEKFLRCLNGGFRENGFE